MADRPLDPPHGSVPPSPDGGSTSSPSSAATPPAAPAEPIPAAVAPPAGVPCPRCSELITPGVPHSCAAAMAPTEAVSLAAMAATASQPVSPVGRAAAPMKSGERPAIVINPGAFVANTGEDLTGSIISERYQVITRLTQGGMGVVYQARHMMLDSVVAIKVLLRAEESDQQRFMREARLASKINHPNTVYISDFGILPDGRTYLVMEYLSGRTLGSLLLGGRRFDPLRACRIAVQIARGLQAVHDKGIVHRDLKPDNIFLVEREGKKDVVKIVDFGLAKMQAGQRLTQDGTVVGTAEYISPEQVTGQDTDARSDQYSLGCILYELLTAQLPFEGESTATLIYKHVYKNPTPPRKLRPEMNIPASVEAVVLRCMAKKPQDRYPTMTALEQALLQEEQLLSPKASGGADVLVARSHPTLSVERPWLYWGGIGGGVAALLVLVFVLVSRPSPMPNPPPVPRPDAAADLRPLPPALPPPTSPAGAPDMAKPAVIDMMASTVANVPSEEVDGGVGEEDSGSDGAEDGPDSVGDGAKPDGSHEAGKPRTRTTVAVRFSVEPAAAPAKVSCKRVSASCKGSCSVTVSAGAVCTVAAPGFVSKVVRVRELKGEHGKRQAHITLSPVKLKLN